MSGLLLLIIVLIAVFIIYNNILSPESVADISLSELYYKN